MQPPKPRMPTTREIAAACGCNQSTVSHALRGNPRIPDSTRKRILAVAEGLGWKPNPFASVYMAHLRSTRSPSHQAGIGFLIANAKSGRIADQPIHLQRHYHGACARAEELGYSLEAIWLHEPHLTARRLTSVLRNRNIVALVVAGIVHPSEILHELDWSQFAAVSIGFSLPEPALHRVAVHTLHGFDQVLRKVMNLGYRRLAAVVSLFYDERVNHGLLYPTYYAQHRWAAEGSIRTYLFPMPEEKEIPGIQDWLRQHMPDVVVGENIVWQAIQEMGWRVPQDVAFVNVDAAPEFPDIGGFNQRHELHGSVAVDMVVGQLLRNQRGIPEVPRSTLIEGTWVDGLSIPPKADIPGIKKSAKFPLNTAPLRSAQRPAK